MPAALRHAVMLRDGQAEALALNAPLIVTGDSWGSGSIQYTGANDHRGIRWAIPTALGDYSGNAIGTTPSGNKAVSGQTSVQVSAQLAGALATLPANKPFVWFCAERFLNDVGGSTSGPVASGHYDTDIATVRRAGGRSIIGTCPPSRSDHGWTAAQQARVNEFNHLVRAKACRDVLVIDYDKLGLVDANYSDGIHLTTNGWDVAASAIVAQPYGLMKWMPGTAAKLVDTTVYTANPDLAGGTTAPTSWTLDISGGDGAVGTWSAANKELTISGTYTGTTAYILIQQIGSGAPLPSNPDYVEGVCEVTLAAPPQDHIIALDFQIIIYTAAFGTLATARSALYSPPVAETATAMNRAAGSYVLRTPKVQVASGTPNYKITTLSTILIDTGGAEAVSAVIGWKYGALRLGVQ